MLLTVGGDHVPVIPLLEVVGKTGATEPLQMVPIAVNVGVMLELTVIDSVVPALHCPPVAVKVYVPEVVLLTVAGFHVPVIPLSEVDGRTGTAPPAHTSVGILNVAVTIGFTVKGKVAVVAHCPVAGVKVYVPEVVLLTVAGLHVPVIPLVEVPGKTGAASPLQIAASALKVGVTAVFTVIGILAVDAH